MNINLALSLAANLVQASEGCKLIAYLDKLPKVPLWTIGFGTTRINGQPVKPGQTCTLTQAIGWCGEDMRASAQFVLGKVSVPLNEPELAALTSLTYNIGDGNFERSDVLAALNKGLRQVAADRFLEYDHSGGVEVRGLTTRRARERALFLSAQPPVTPAPAPVKPPVSVSADDLNLVELNRLGSVGHQPGVSA